MTGGWEERAEDELDELVTKIEKLKLFIDDTTAMASVSGLQAMAAALQLYFMRKYEDMLRLRLADPSR